MKIIIAIVFVLSVGAYASEDYYSSGFLALVFVGLIIVYWKRKKKLTSNDLTNSDYDKVIESRENLNNYYTYMDKMQAAEKSNNIADALEYVKKTIPFLDQFVDDTIASYGTFDIGTIPAIDIGCRYWPALGDMNNLSLLKEAVENKKELKNWQSSIEKAFIDVELSGRIKVYLQNNPGQYQNTFGKELNVSGKDTTRIVKNLEKLGLVKREVDGKTYKLYAQNKK